MLREKYLDVIIVEGPVLHILIFAEICIQDVKTAPAQVEEDMRIFVMNS